MDEENRGLGTLKKWGDREAEYSGPNYFEEFSQLDDRDRKRLNKAFDESYEGMSESIVIGVATASMVIEAAGLAFIAVALGFWLGWMGPLVIGGISLLTGITTILREKPSRLLFSRVKRVDEDNSPELLQIFNEEKEKISSKGRKIVLSVVKSSRVPAAARPIGGKKGEVVLSTELLEELDKEQVRSVIKHELEHVAGDGLYKMSLPKAFGVPIAIGIIPAILFLVNIPWYITLVVVTISVIISKVLTNIMAHKDEKRADNTATTEKTGVEFALALLKISNLVLKPNDSIQRVRTLLVDPHPSTVERVENALSDENSTIQLPDRETPGFLSKLMGGATILIFAFGFIYSGFLALVSTKVPMEFAGFSVLTVLVIIGGTGLWMLFDNLRNRTRLDTFLSLITLPAILIVPCLLVLGVGFIASFMTTASVIESLGVIGTFSLATIIIAKIGLTLLGAREGGIDIPRMESSESHLPES